LDKQALIESFFELVRIDSPSMEEAKLAAHLEKKLVALGFSVSFDESGPITGSNTGNLIARLPGSAPGAIVLNAHMDCVEPCRGIEPYVEDGIIRSRGNTILSADDKAGIAAILEAIRFVLQEGRPHPEIWVVLTTCEELNLNGARALQDDLFEKGTPCFVFDAVEAPGSVVVGAPFHYTFAAVFEGIAAHAGASPESGISAIQMAAAAVGKMKLGRIDERTTANIGMILGGRATNIVPDSCTVVGECRSLFAERLEECKAQIFAALEQGAVQYGGSVGMKGELDYPGIHFDEADPLVEKLACIAREVGLEPKCSISGGGADANVLPAKGVVPITLGIGMKDPHSVSEYISVKDLEDTASYIAAIITSF